MRITCRDGAGACRINQREAAGTICAEDIVIFGQVMGSVGGPSVSLQSRSIGDMALIKRKASEAIPSEAFELIWARPRMLSVQAKS